MRAPRVLVVLVLVAAAAGCSGDGSESSEEPVAAPTTAPTTTQRQDKGDDGDVFGRIPEVVAEVEPSVVAVAVEGQAGRGEGSGVIWDDEGLIVTNNHVIEGAANVEVVLANGTRLEAEIEEADSLSDLAVLRVDQAGLPAADFAEALPEVGELAIAIGNPSGFEQSVTAGIVSGLHRAIPSGGQTPALVDLIQTDAAISPGNSGGALVDADGDVIGINVAYLPPQSSGAVSIGFAIPAPTTVSIVRQLLDTGEVKRAFLGINPVQITPGLADQFGLEVESGAGVERVEPGSAADEGGLRGGDVIVAFEGEDVATIEDLFAQLRKFQPGDEVTLTVVRDGERRELEVTLAERPSE
jgi:S1-C subfamily serine protease